MPDAANYVAVEIDVEEIDDHRSAGVVVESGVKVQFGDDAEARRRVAGTDRKKRIVIFCCATADDRSSPMPFGQFPVLVG